MGKSNFINYQQCIQYEKVNPKIKYGEVTVKDIAGNWIRYLGHATS